jgi:glycosyltransferase involved in cell wall biosynthesis
MSARPEIEGDAPHFVGINLIAGALPDGFEPVDARARLMSSSASSSNARDGDLRIAYLLNQYPKISHTFIRREIQALERCGVDVMRVSLRGWGDTLTDDDDRTERGRTRYVLRDGASVLLLAAIRMLLTRPIRAIRALMVAWSASRRADRPLPVHLAYLAEAARIEPWLRKAGIHHVHAHFGTNSAEVAMLVRLLGGPRWSFTVHGPEEFDKRQLIGLANKVRNCEFVVAISSFARSQIYRCVEHEHWRKVHVVHCGLEPAYQAGSPSSMPGARRLVCVGRLCEQKGQLLLLEAARRLAQQGTDFELVLAGDGEMRAEIEALVVRDKLQARVRITGWLSGEQVRDELLAARALVLPSFAEGLPVVIMEAMALGRPVVSTYVAGIPELVISGEHGWLVPAGDVDALVHAMQSCLDADSATLMYMGEAARERVLARHDVDSEAARMTKLFYAAAHGRDVVLDCRSP